MPARLLRVLSTDADAAGMLETTDPALRPVLLGCFERGFYRAANDIQDVDPTDANAMRAHALYAQLMALALQLAAESFSGPIAVYAEPVAAD